MMTRDVIQGFLDGYKMGGGDDTKIPEALKSYLVDHHSYPVQPAEADALVSDVSSYRKLPDKLVPTKSVTP